MPTLQHLGQRLARFIRLEPAVCHEIAADPQAIREAALIVLLASLLDGIGRGGVLLGVATGILVNWLLWTCITQLAASRLYGSEVTFVRLARVMGYATAPLALGFLSIFGCLGVIWGLAGWLLSLFYGFRALREITNLSTESSLVSIIIGSVISLGAGQLLAILH